MTFRSRQRVRFHEADPAGIAFFANAYVYAHTAYDELLREGGLPLEVIAARGDVLPIKKSSAEHLRPLPSGCAFEVDIDVLRLGTTSFTLRHRLLMRPEQASQPSADATAAQPGAAQEVAAVVAAVVESVHVCARVDGDGRFSKQSVPDDLRKILAPHLSP